MKIKICGLRREEDIRIVNKYNPDLIGFIFAESKRKITYEKARELKKRLNKNIKIVGVFVNEKIENIILISDELDYIQLHGDEDKKYIEVLKEKTNKKIIKVIRVKNTEEILKGDNLPCDILLLDTYSEDVYGGVGKTFDYSLIPKLKHKFFIAGGLKEDNVEYTFNLEAFGVDINSGVESDGHKDEEKIKRIIQKVRSQKKN